MKSEGVIFLSRPAPLDNYEFLILGEVLFGGERILEKMRKFVLIRKEYLKKEGCEFVDCDVCQKSQFSIREIDDKKFLLSRNSCLTRGILKLTEIFEFAEREGFVVY